MVKTSQRRRSLKDSRLLHNAIKQLQNDSEFWDWLMRDYDEFIRTRQFHQDFPRDNSAFYALTVDADNPVDVEVTEIYKDPRTRTRWLTVEFRHTHLPLSQIRFYPHTLFWKRLPFAEKKKLLKAYHS